MLVTLIVLNFVGYILDILLLPKYLHIFQLKDNQSGRYLKFFSKITLIFAIINVFFVVFELFFKFSIYVFIINLLLLFCNLIFSYRLIRGKKTPLKYTGRIKRMYFISMILLLISTPFVCSVGVNNILLPLLPIVADFLNIYDKLRNKKYIKQASEKLKNSNTKVIAITGSNGKTSVKNILEKMLKKEYSILATPKSYNTPLGIAKFINDSLKENTEFLILEYGARRVGDIDKLCRLFGADYGIVTMVAPQHLESFKSIDNVYKTKNELPKFLGEKMCVFNLDNEYTHRMYNEKSGEKLGISILADADANADDIKIIDARTQFNLHIGGHNTSVSTRLLGRHNVSNIMLASTLAHYLDVRVDEICDAIFELDYVPHRLELIRTDINILDDSYNCSITSANESIRVLSQFPNKKMIVTPGIIEGGRDEYNINFELGTMCAVADFVVVVGKHNERAIIDGLLSTNFSKEKILLATTLNEAQQYFSKLNINDTLLLLNDLPDDYS